METEIKKGEIKNRLIEHLMPKHPLLASILQHCHILEFHPKDDNYLRLVIEAEGYYLEQLQSSVYMTRLYKALSELLGWDFTVSFRR